MRKELITLMSKLTNKKQISNDILQFVLLEDNKLVAINGFAMLIVTMMENTDLKILLDVNKLGKNNDNIYFDYPVNSKLVNNYPQYQKLLITNKIKEQEIKIFIPPTNKFNKEVVASYIICGILKNNIYFDVETIYNFLSYDKITLDEKVEVIIDDSKFQLDGEFEIYSERYKFNYVQMLIK